MVKNKNNNLSDEDNKLWETVSNKAKKYKKTNRIILSDKAEIKTQPLKEEIQSVAQKYLSPNQRVEIEYLPGEEIGEE